MSLYVSSFIEESRDMETPKIQSYNRNEEPSPGPYNESQFDDKDWLDEQTRMDRDWYNLEESGV